jgi:hypothetical protein
MRRISLFALALAACSAGESARVLAEADVQAGASASDSTIVADSAMAPQVADVDTVGTPVLADTSIVRGLYVNRFAAQSPARMRKLIAIADSTEINALVIDMKDEFGLNYQSPDPTVARNAGNAGRIPRLQELLDTLHAHGILPVARIVVFKDSVAARLNPDHVIRTPAGEPWRDKKGLTWVDPYDTTIWEYNIRVAEELVRLGFREIQFDYIRFPEPYKSLPPQVFRDTRGVSKPQALANFFKEACPRVRKLGASCTADIFGLVTTVNGALEIGQEWEQLAPVTDVLLPMVYPSHYPPGSFGVSRPNAEPYRIVNVAIARAHERNLKLGITSPAHVRPYLQAFSLKGMMPKYEAHELEEQKRAVYDAGFDGWVLWSPGSTYDAYLPALERNLVSRRKPFTPRNARQATSRSASDTSDAAVSPDR